MFNRGKVFGALGNEGEAQKSYRQALSSALGVAPSTWTKACAAIKKHTSAELKSMEEAAEYYRSFQGVVTSCNDSTK